jgi:hypothetical protein
MTPRMLSALIAVVGVAIGVDACTDMNANSGGANDSSASSTISNTPPRSPWTYDETRDPITDKVIISAHAMLTDAAMPKAVAELKFFCRGKTPEDATFQLATYYAQGNGQELPGLSRNPNAPTLEYRFNGLVNEGFATMASAIRSQPQGRRKGKSLLVALHHRKLITPDAQRTGLFTELEPDAATVCYCTKNARPLVRRWFKRARIARSAFHQEHQCPKDHLNSKRNTSGAWRW